MVKNVHGLLVKYHLFLSDLNETHGHDVTLRKWIFTNDLFHFDTKMQHQEKDPLFSRNRRPAT
jgi:hypothetical protein